MGAMLRRYVHSARVDNPLVWFEDAEFTGSRFQTTLQAVTLWRPTVRYTSPECSRPNSRVCVSKEQRSASAELRALSGGIGGGILIQPICGTF
jgi:hypothetical protein